MVAWAQTVKRKVGRSIDRGRFLFWGKVARDLEGVGVRWHLRQDRVQALDSAVFEARLYDAFTIVDDVPNTGEDVSMAERLRGGLPLLALHTLYSLHLLDLALDEAPVE